MFDLTWYFLFRALKYSEKEYCCSWQKDKIE